MKIFLTIIEKLMANSMEKFSTKNFQNYQTSEKLQQVNFDDLYFAFDVNPVCPTAITIMDSINPENKQQT